MIYCVHLHEVEAYLVTMGFHFLTRTPGTVVYERDDVVVTPRNVPRLPEIHMNDALDQAGIDPPALQTFWCD